jgi:hypothetical protein
MAGKLHHGQTVVLKVFSNRQELDEFYPQERESYQLIMSKENHECFTVSCFDFIEVNKRVNANDDQVFAQPSRVAPVTS